MRALLAAALVLLPAPQAWAGAGTTPLEFLSLDADARAVALGGAYTALATDANAMLYNPAGLAFAGRSQAVFMHNQYFEGVTQEYAAVALRQGWGGLVNYLSYGDIPKTTISNKSGAGLGSFGITDLALAGGYGRTVRPGLAVGGGAKLVRETIETVSAEGMAFDAGALYAPPWLPGLRLAAALRNLGPQIRYQREGQNLPLEARIGGAYTTRPAGQETTLALDVVKPRGNDPETAVGLESVLAGRLPIRLGYDMRNDAGLGLTAGFGWLSRDFRVDYAFVSFGDLGSAHRVSALVRWGPAGAGPSRLKTDEPAGLKPDPTEAPKPMRHYLLAPLPTAAPAEPAAVPEPPAQKAAPKVPAAPRADPPAPKAGPPAPKPPAPTPAAAPKSPPEPVEEF